MCLCVCVWPINFAMLSKCSQDVGLKCGVSNCSETVIEFRNQDSKKVAPIVCLDYNSTFLFITYFIS